MDKKLIERLAREAHITPRAEPRGGALGMHVPMHYLEDFAALVAEECAKIAEGSLEYGALDLGGETRGYGSAAAIRQAFGREP